MEESVREAYQGKLKKALNYKVTIKAEFLSKKDYRIFTDEKKGVWYSCVELCFFSFHEPVLNAIRKWLTDFFICHHFGLAQSKGFGFFTVDGTNRQTFEISLKENYRAFYKMKLTNVGEYEKVFNTIKREYQVLKSGINHKGYIKSKLFEYMCGKSINWEKRRIKEALKQDYPDVFNVLAKKGDKNRIAGCEAEGAKTGKIQTYKYIRALLGLAEHNEYQTGRNNNLNLARIRIIIKDDTDTISRFQSPVQFKIFNGHLYLLPNELPDDIFDYGFSFYLEREFRNKRKEEERNPLFTISTPTREEFDLVEFLDKTLTVPARHGDRSQWLKSKGVKKQ